jgi:hypothetical protein
LGRWETASPLYGVIMKKKFTKDGDVKLVDNDDVIKNLTEAGWTEVKPKAEKQNADSKNLNNKSAKKSKNSNA